MCVAQIFLTEHLTEAFVVNQVILERLTGVSMAQISQGKI